MNNNPPQPPAAPAHPITTLAALAAALGMSAALAQAPTASGRLQLELIGQYQTNLFDESAAEINAYDPQTRQLFVINSQSRMIDVLDISDPTNPQLVRSLDVSGSIAGGGDLNSLAVQNGIVALAVANDNETDTGWAVFLAADNLDLPLATARVGALPDMITFTPDGRHALVANEGEPNDSYAVDPQGSIAVIDLGSGSIADVGKVGDDAVRIAGFEAFSADQLREKGVRIFGANNPSAAQDLEPEYIAVSADSSTAYVALQENNALAIVDIAAAAVTDVVALGFKDHSQPGNELDASNKDGQINIRNWPVLGMYQPDALATYAVAGKTYMVTANEGDARDYDGFSEETRIKDLNLDAQSFPTAGQLQKDANLGRLKTTTTLGDSDGDGDFDQIYSYGARSFSIWNEAGELVYDSGSDLERITAERFPEHFNSDDENKFDSRSDDKGPEPEGVAIGTIDGNTYAFIGLERIGGVAVYDISTPTAPEFVNYATSRNFAAGGSDAVELAPEGITFIAAADSPSGDNLLVMSNEVSGSTTIYRIQAR